MIGLLSIDFDGIYLLNIQISTSVGEALDNYGKLLNQSRHILYTPLPTYIWGFDTGKKPSYDGDPPTNFDHGTFAVDYTTEVKTLTDDQYRVLLLIKYISSISTCSIYCINQILQAYFTNGAIYAKTSAPNIVEIKYDFELEAWEYQIITNINLLPIPLGKQIIMTRV